MIYILVPVFKRLDKTIDFIQSLDRQSINDFKLIITDDSPDYEHYSYCFDDERIVVVKGTGTLFWGGGVNYAIKHLHKTHQLNSEDIVIFANNDILVSELMLEKLVSLLKINPNIIVHPKLIDENGRAISAGSKVLSWFPFITRDHGSTSKHDLIKVDLASARFLAFKAQTLEKLKGIRKDIPHYGGDNDFTLRAKKKGIDTFICTSAICYVDESVTGAKMSNISGVIQLYRSFFSIKSPNSIRHRFVFIRGHFGVLLSVLIVSSMTFNSMLKFCINKLRNE